MSALRINDIIVFEWSQILLLVRTQQNSKKKNTFFFPLHKQFSVVEVTDTVCHYYIT